MASGSNIERLLQVLLALLGVLCSAGLVWAGWISIAVVGLMQDMSQVATMTNIIDGRTKSIVGALVNSGIPVNVVSLQAGGQDESRENGKVVQYDVGQGDRTL